MDVPDVASHLFSLPPARFTAERNALATRIAERDPRAAAIVRKLARPVGLAWVLNRLAREDPRAVEALLAAGERLRAGQRRALGGHGGGELRAAADALGERARALRAHGERVLAEGGRAVAPPTLARLELLVRVVATAPGPEREALRRGVLPREPELVSAELSGLAVVPGGPANPAPSRAPAGRAGSERGARRAAPRGAVARETSAAAARERAREERARAREAQDRARALAAARRAARAAGARAEREERAAATALARAQRARELAGAARAEAQRAAARVATLERGR